MKKITTLFISIFILFVFLIGCSAQSGVDYLEPLYGKWNIKEYTNNDIEYIPDIYSKGILNIDKDTETIQMDFFVSEQTISEKLLDWKAKWPDLVIDTYKIAITAKIRYSGKDKISLIDIDTNIIITGSGENFEGFYAFERSLFEMTKSTQSNSLVGGMVNNAVSKAAGTKNLFPVIFDELEYSLDGDSLTITGKDSNLFNNKGNIYLLLKKIN